MINNTITDLLISSEQIHKSIPWLHKKILKLNTCNDFYFKYADMNPRNFWWPTFGYNKILTRSLNHPSHHQSANSVDIDTLYCSCFVIICSLITVFCLLRKLWFTRRTLWHASSFKSLIRSIFSSIEGPKVNRQRDTKNTLMGFTVMLRRQHQLSL